MSGGLILPGEGDRSVSVCPACGRPDPRLLKLDSDALVNTEALPDPPSEGDAFLCWSCGTWAIFTGNGLALRRATFDERADLDADPNAQSILAAWRRR